MNPATSTNANVCIAGTGSVNGVRRVLARLVAEGLVLTEQAGQAWPYRANREHVAWPAVNVLTQLRTEFFTRLRQALAALNPQCVYAGLFGSAARGDGTAESDIDLLLVYPDETIRTGSWITPGQGKSLPWASKCRAGPATSCRYS